MSSISWKRVFVPESGAAMDNEMRINRAITALEAAYSEEEDGLTSKINDLLTDLMHLCKPGLHLE